MAVTREEVVLGYRMILGRDPESEAVISSHLNRRDTQALAEVLLRSVEFRLSTRFKDFLEVRAHEKRGKSIRWSYEKRANLRVTVIGNCQAGTVARLLQAMTGGIRAQSLELTPALIERIGSGAFDIAPLMRNTDLIFMQPVDTLQQVIARDYPKHVAKLRLFPPISYSAFHPDSTSVAIRDEGPLEGPMSHYHSSIAFWAWQASWSAEEAITLYRDEVYEKLGFYGYRESSDQVLIEYGRRTGLAMEPLLQRWRSRGCWMHTVNHPTLPILADITAALLRREGIEPIAGAERWVEDTLARWASWPVYPPIARHLGIDGSELFKISRTRCTDDQPVLTMSLTEFVRASFACYQAFTPDRLHTERILSPQYAELAELRPPLRVPVPATGLLETLAAAVGRLWAKIPGTPHPPATVHAQPAPGATHNPYAGLPDHHFWRRMMEQTPPAEVDPVLRARWNIGRTDKVATAGSCFAQHISRTLSQQGYHHLVAEAGADLPPLERSARQFGVFSARYGNLYTARQLLQLLERAFGEYTPVDNAWQRPDGRWVDPFRPQIEPNGYASANEVAAARDVHLPAVRAMVDQMDVFVFTLGLTECWQRRDDGAVYPLAPGAVAGRHDPAHYEFVNFGVAEVAADIHAAVRRLRSANPRAKLIFTVSPVPLIATYEDRHVLVSTTESKAILRAAIGEVAARDAGVDYFPSYEIITGAHTRGAYFAPDLRTVTDEGVAHVMRVFLRHYTGEDAVNAATSTTEASARATEQQAAQVTEQRSLQQVLCDEETLEQPRPG